MSAGSSPVGRIENFLNVLEEFRDILFHSGLGDACPLETFRRTGESDLSVRLPASPESSEVAERVTRLFEDDPRVATMRHVGGRILLRLQDETIATAGKQLERERSIPTSQPYSGKVYRVEFCNPNATKGLHIGHLRNLAIGQAFACALEAAGATVERQCQISDAGQQSGEAMAGYLLFALGATPESEGKKSDHFVGDLYARYVKEAAVDTGQVSQHDMGVARELDRREDLATLLLHRWLTGDPHAEVLRQTICNWALDGQRLTLEKIGIKFDHPLFESGVVPRLAGLIERGIEIGVFTYSSDGRLIHETGRKEYPIFPLARADGFPMVTLRSLAIWHELMEQLTDTTTVHVCGMEWREHTVSVKEILQRLKPGAVPQPSFDVAHGMVYTDSDLASSSKGSGMLIDDLLEELGESSHLRAIAIGETPGCKASDLAVLVALGFVLDYPIAKPMRVTKAAMLERRANGGMLLARAWTHACATSEKGCVGPAPNDPRYRFAVMKAQQWCSILRSGLDQIDIAPMVRFCAQLSRWYLDQPMDPAVAGITRVVLGHAMQSLGLIASEQPSAFSNCGGRSVSDSSL